MEINKTSQKRPLKNEWMFRSMLFNMHILILIA